MQGGLSAQKNTGRFAGSEECRKLRGHRRMQEGLRDHMNARRSGRSEVCRKV